MHFHCGSRDVAEAIVSKLSNSQRIASGGVVTSPPVERQIGLARPASVHSEDAATPPAAAPKAVRWAAEEPEEAPSAPTSGEKSAVALYDFDAAGDDELSVKEGEDLVVLDDSNEDWWSVRNAHGDQGVVPAQYVEVSGMRLLNSPRYGVLCFADQ
jgi:hypothetical protein